jgi:aryl-alcohol dehydrogenase-like predicted oxidoreductase
VLDAAYAAGVRYVDAARGYGRAEEFLAAWLRSHPVEDVLVGSKWGYAYTAGWQTQATTHEVKDHTLSMLARQLAESRSLLGERLRLYQIHSATEASGVLERPEVLDRLAELKASSAPLLIGLTLSCADAARTLECALEIERDGWRLFDTVQATWNALEPSLGPLLASARAAGMGVIVKEALANGRLTTRNTEPAFAERRAILERLAARLGCALDQLALAWALDQPWADCVLSGATTVAQVCSNADALDVRLDEAARVELSALAETPEDYWRARAALPWN